MGEYLQPVLDWISLHPQTAGVVIFFIALLESAAIIGLFMPGTVLMFGVGTIIATGSLELESTLIWAALGGIVGDGLSFFLGRVYHQKLRVVWPFKKYPGLVSTGVTFFHKHGGKSVFLARFLGPLRPIVPAVAGMLQMPPARFFAMDIPSALIWSPTFILPGVLFGASLGLAAQVAGRLVILVAVLVAVIWFTLWLVRYGLRYFQPRASVLANRALDWSRSHPRVRPLAGALLDPDHPEWRGLAVLSVMLLTTSMFFALLFSGVIYSHVLSNLDQALLVFLQDLRTPWVDQFMVGITKLGDAVFIAGFLGIASLWLLVRRRWSALAHWWGLALSVWVSTHLLKAATRIPRPADTALDFSTYAFPSGHASLSVAVFGFAAVLVASRIRVSLHWIPYLLAVLVSVPIAFSRLYLGVHWFSDVLGGIALGIAWLALFGIAYRRHPRPGLPWKGVSLAAVAALVLGGPLYIRQHFDSDLAHYQTQVQQQTLSAENWWRTDWQRLATYRDDLEGSRQHPLAVQWAGSLDQLTRYFGARGWHRPNTVDPENVAAWFTSDLPAVRYPVLPQLHAGNRDSLHLIREIDDDTLLVLRLWPSGYSLRDRHVPVWVGTVTLMQVRPAFHLLYILRTDANFDRPLTLFMPDLSGLNYRSVQRIVEPDIKQKKPFIWNGNVILMTPESSS